MDRDDEERKNALLLRLEAAPHDTAVLIELGNLAFRNGFRNAALTAYRRAIEIDSAEPAFRVNLGNALLQAGELEAARVAYVDALALDPDFAPAHQGLNFVYSRLGDDANARRHRDAGFPGNALQRVPFRGNGAATNVVVLVSTEGGDFNTDAILPSSVYDVTKVFAEYAHALPVVGVPMAVVNAISDADRCRGALEAAARLLESAGNPPVVNPPRAILRTTRLEIAQRLRALPGVTVPRAALVSRQHPEGGGFAYPFLLRAPGHHTGRHFAFVSDERALRSAIALLPGEELLALQFIDTRSNDGLFRKYRVLAVDGDLFPAHVAASDTWKVHFFTSGAAENDALRDEDAEFLNDAPGVVGSDVWAALHHAVDEIALEYMGIDFAVDREGGLVVFEANATMSVYPVPADARWDYRRAATQRIVDAFGRLIRRCET